MEASDTTLGNNYNKVIEKMQSHKDEDVATAFVIVLRKDGMMDLIADMGQPPELVFAIVSEAMTNYTEALKSRGAANDGASV
jgi:hypothetical protein